jgi:hypothetical protein
LEWALGSMQSDNYSKSSILEKALAGDLVMLSEKW